ncbi:hypothetical protein [Brevibacillus sp. DP1.3A]|uniref:hypothetical protein n=1 Tax=Brevibacillus sp. DP1.3A TaxID=2738867 RepID=UPI001D16BCBC|nr:hypothetical protein [Brevibacillus sp. DP1.3A]UED78037.1 hypothetical protein HP399_021155 [Brevibacillus sp. DP1.3A]
MHVKIIPGSSADSIRSACYHYLLSKYRREKPYDRNICQGEYRGTGKERIQSRRSVKGMPEKGSDE